MRDVIRSVVEGVLAAERGESGWPVLDITLAIQCGSKFLDSFSYVRYGRVR